MKKLLLVLLALTLPLFFIACNDDDDDGGTDPKSGASTLTITHWGVDWSAGKAYKEGDQVDYNTIDGETISWCPFGDYVEGVTGVWYRAYVDKIYKVGAGDVTTISAIDTTKWSTGVCGTPLVKGDIWAAKCRDGYVIFEVLENPDPESQNWEAEVKYKFSKDLEF